jgi:1-deoxy-D-xylulose-5-phosphate synthase
MLQTALEPRGPSAIRYPRGAGPGAVVKEQPVALPIGKAEVLHEGSEVAIWGLGALVPMASELHSQLEREGYSAALINARFAKPLDTELLEQYARRVGLIVTFEDHVLMGGFGSAVLEHLSSKNLRVPVVRIGWPDAFIEHGKVDQLREKFGLSVAAALEKSRPFLKALPRKRFAVTG